jgi:hypothetical protein
LPGSSSPSLDVDDPPSLDVDDPPSLVDGAPAPDFDFEPERLSVL